MLINFHYRIILHILLICSIETEVFECPNGKEYQECGTSCPTTCENKDEIRICTLECVQGKLNHYCSWPDYFLHIKCNMLIVFQYLSGCFCPTGTVELDDKCVAPEECPSTNTTAPEKLCPAGMVYEECGTACPTTCENKDVLIRPCTLQCVQGKVIITEFT